MKKKKIYKYRVKELCHDIGDIFKSHKVVQVKRWFGWVTIKDFGEFRYNDGSFNILEPNDKHYVDVCIEEFMDKLKEEI